MQRRDRLLHLGSTADTANDDNYDTTRLDYSYSQLMWPVSERHSSNYTVSQKNDTDLAHYNFNAHQPILIIFGRDVAERVCYQTVICYPTSPY